jgi:hypothetical protein
MKWLKMAGLVALAVAALTAFLGADAASATVLCKTSTDPCPEFWRWSSGTEIHATLTATTLETESVFKFIHNTCTESTLGGIQENEGSATETVTMDMEVSKATCTNGGLGYFFPTEFEIHQIPGTNDGTFTGVGEVALGGNCAYTATQVGTLTGGSKPTLDMEVVLERTKGFVCVTPVGWDATYTITSPTPIFVTEG